MIALALIFILLGQTCFAADIGDTCSNDAACAGITNVECSDGKCECKEGFEGTSGTQTCTPEDGKIGGACSTGSTCEVTDTMECTSNDICQCKNGLTGADGTTDCSAIGEGKVNAACGDAKPCTATNSACVNGFCTCNSGCTGGKGDAVCVPDAGKIGGSCKATQPFCDDTANAQCDSNVCKCNDGYQAAPGKATCALKSKGNKSGSLPFWLLSVIFIVVSKCDCVV